MDMRNEFILKNWNALQGTVYVPSNNDSQFKNSFVKVQNHIDGKGEDDFDQTAHDLLSELPFLKKRHILDADYNSEKANLNDSQTRKSNN